MNEFTKREEEKSMASVFKRENGSGLLPFLQRMGKKNLANFSANAINLRTREKQCGTEIILKEHSIPK